MIVASSRDFLGPIIHDEPHRAPRTGAVEIVFRDAVAWEIGVLARYFLTAADAIEAATSFAILIWESRPVRP